MQALEAEAQAFEVQAKSLLSLTFRSFSRSGGFAEIDRGALPLKAWKDCLRCPKFQCCDEVAVIKVFDGRAYGGSGYPPLWAGISTVHFAALLQTSRYR